MGLDMYMYCKPQGATELPETEVLYLRKANQVRRWLVEHTGYDEDANCVVYALTKDQLEALLADCKAVQENHKLAPEILPTECGFFFDDEEYGGYYFDTLGETVEQLEEILADTDFESDEIVYWEWW